MDVAHLSLQRLVVGNADKSWQSADLTYQIDVAVGHKLKEINRKAGNTQGRPAGKPPTRQDYWDGRDSGIRLFNTI